MQVQLKTIGAHALENAVRKRAKIDWWIMSLSRSRMIWLNI